MLIKLERCSTLIELSASKRINEREQQCNSNTDQERSIDQTSDQEQLVCKEPINSG